MAECHERLEHSFDTWLPAAATHPATLHEAMRYTVMDGGKRIRPTLVYAGGQAAGATPQFLDRAACAIELIHAYSLIHDDLPAMDDDDLRRGKPSCHRAFGEATAILAGDALQSLAFQVLAGDTESTVSEATRLRMIKTLALAAGSRGMAGGQAIDLAATGQQLNIAELEDMHIHKTGALIRASVVLGALCGSGPVQADIEKLDHYAKCIGLAFQIRDDILDVEGETATLGKNTGMDQRLDKSTYPSVIGLDAARQRATELHSEAMNSLAGFDASADPLRWISAYIVERER
ncbi:MAG: (2E,6E)-farnesyl diphosphate synthase [Gammaproteobacteria bacterium]|jgi:farnesyl diphosphate synthase|nr:(2E,6E)-farnesyl diphosphate synthase [Gammaproteobacteria bacterium]